MLPGKGGGKEEKAFSRLRKQHSKSLEVREGEWLQPAGWRNEAGEAERS